MMLIFNQSMMRRSWIQRVGGGVQGGGLGRFWGAGEPQSEVCGQVSSEALKDDPSTPGEPGS